MPVNGQGNIYRELTFEMEHGRDSRYCLKKNRNFKGTTQLVATMAEV